MSEKTSIRHLHIQLFIGIALLVLLAKAAQLQLVDSTMRQKAGAVAVDSYTIYPSRGIIYDRANRPLVTNNPMYDLLVTYNQIDPQMDTLRFCELLEIDRAYFETILEKDWSSPRYDKTVPFTFLKKIPKEKFLTFQESLHEFPGFQIQHRNARSYPIPSAAHVLGYISEATENDIKNDPDNYSLGDYIGASGVEWAYEEELRGTKGKRYVLKDNKGNEMGQYADGSEDVDPASGLDLILSVDIELQQYAEELLQNKRGAVVAIEPKTGEILTMVTAPTYNPQSLALHNKNRGKAYQGLRENKELPLYNRAILAEYPPGSLFKPFVGLVALQEGITQPQRTITCDGAFYFKGQRLTGCHGHFTCRTISHAIQNSCNTYFITLFRETIDQFGQNTPVAGLDTFNTYLSRFGMQQRLGIDFPGEKMGEYPDGSYFSKVYEKEQRWYSVWVRSLGIGQGELGTTNLQLANMAAILANRGWYKTPHLVRAYKNNVQAIDDKYLLKREVGIDAQHFEPIIDGMEAVVTSGTAKLAYISGIPVCGKTGTAENAGKDHSIFFCFAPKDDPKIALAVYVENAGFGGSVAAPIASLVIEKYLRGEIRGAQRKYLESYIKDMKILKPTP